MLRWQRNIRDGGRWGGGEEEQTVALTTQHTGRVGDGGGEGEQEQTVALTTQHTGQGEDGVEEKKNKQLCWQRNIRDGGRKQN